jgi:Flp pilus assembly pilin Flp
MNERGFCMAIVEYLVGRGECMRAWVNEKFGRKESGQGSIEYVLVILGVVLFLVAAAFLLQGVLSGAVVKISSWIAAVNPPAVP